jgi:hypothetical protein
VNETDLTKDIFDEAIEKSTKENKSLTKVSSVGKLPQTGLIPKRKAKATNSNKFSYAVISGNNSNLLKRVLQ